LLELSEVNWTRQYWLGWRRERRRAVDWKVHDWNARGVLFVPVKVKEKIGIELHALAFEKTERLIRDKIA
jgi:hypothetical protein